MFDVAWTEPVRETVGQRKNRKEHHNNSPGPSRAGSRPDRAPSILSSRSGDSVRSPTQSKSSFLNFFGPNSRKHAGLRKPSTGTLRADSASTGRPSSSYTLDSTVSTESVDTPTPTRGGYIGSICQSEANSSKSGGESIFSEWASRSQHTLSSWSSVVESSCSPTRIVQPLSPTSFVTQSTEVTVSPRGSLNNGDEVTTTVHISSSGTASSQDADSPSRRSPMSPSFEIPGFLGSRPSTGREEMGLEARGWPISPRSNEPSISPRHNKWQPPDAWDCSPESDDSSNIINSLVLDPAPRQTKSRGTTAKRTRTPTAEVTELQRSIRRMEAASDRIVLERLKEQWACVDDAVLYQELELEKQQWMLSALRRRAVDSPSIRELENEGVSKVLALYENHASCSTLSALTFSSEVYHLSTSPLSAKSWPNVHPLTVPGPTSQLPYASNIFSSIHAFYLPSLLPASSIPSILRECHRTLMSGGEIGTAISTGPFTAINGPPQSESKAGTLHLTILDPSPLPSTLGPRLRTWLDNHLILNLEKKFRCINPCRLFPIWLADAGLRAVGSTILPVQFLACCNASQTSKIKDENGFKSPGIGAEERTKQELKSVVGRMLWKEMWGSYVQTDKWWWEDEHIVEECERMQTCWEYAIIEAVKQT